MKFREILTILVVILVLIFGVYAAEEKPFYDRPLILGASLLHIIQMIGWGVAAIFAWQFRGMVEGATRAWNTIFIGTILFALRVYWKFVPGYNYSFLLQEIRYFLGIIAAGLIMLGFIDYYITASRIMEVE